VFDTDPAWSADGKWIAFSHWTSTGRSVWVMAYNGTTAHQVTHPPGSASDITPPWAPDGSKIAFARINGSGFDVWTVRDDGSEPTNLTNTPAAYNFEPNWSRTGRGSPTVPTATRSCR